jgi:phosphate transport system protein
MQQNDHTSRQFDAQLEQTRSKVLLMGGLVEEQVRMAVSSLRGGAGGASGALIDQVLDVEVAINALEIEIDELCTNIIARRTPTAIDLRVLVMVVKTITDLERVGDEAKKIALMARELTKHGRVHVPYFAEIQRIADIVMDMLRRSLDAFARLELEDTPEIARRDLEVDDSFLAVLRELLTYMIEDPRTISTALDIVFIAKSLERVGDHAKNISEYVVYMIKGKDVRHVTLEEIEEAIKT